MISSANMRSVETSPLLPWRDPDSSVFNPHGAYYAMTDIAGFGFENDVEFAGWLVRDTGTGSGSRFVFLQSIRGVGLSR